MPDSDTILQLDPAIDNYAVMGNPVAHSKSPQIHHAFAEQTGQRIAYHRIRVEESGFSAALDRFQQAGGKGLNITVPFKVEAWRAVDHPTPRAERAQAVNTLWFDPAGDRCGDTTDGIGLLRDLAHHRIELAQRRVLVLGSGGAVNGVLGELLDAAPLQLTVANRNPERAYALVSRFSEFTNLAGCGFDALAGEHYDVVINGTPAGLKGELPVLPEDLLAPGACCYDMVYGDQETLFVRWAKQHGAALALDGLGMLVEQAAESFYIWRGVRPQTQPVIGMLRGGVARSR